MAARIQSFLLAAQPNAYCAGCLAKSLGLSFLYPDDPEAVAREAVATLPTSVVQHVRGDCVLCGLRMLVTSARTDSPRSHPS